MPVFVDSNVLVYARDSSHPDKRPGATAWMQHLWRTRQGRISTQVLQEYYVVMTRKIRPGWEPARVRKDVRRMFAWQPVVLDARVIEAAWAVEDRFQISFWDALIVAAARTARCDRLLTEDLQDGMDFDGVVVVDPFRTAPPGE